VKTLKGKRLFRIRWKGYDSKHDSWEPEENLGGARVAMDEFLKDTESNSTRKITRGTRGRDSPAEAKPSASSGERKSQRGRPRKVNYKVEDDEDEDSDKDGDFAPTQKKFKEVQKKFKASEKKGAERAATTKQGNSGSNQPQSQLDSLITKRLASNKRHWYDDDASSDDSAKESPSEKNIIDSALKAARETTAAADDSALAETADTEKDGKSTENPTNSGQPLFSPNHIPSPSKSPALENGDVDDDDVSAEISKAKAEKLAQKSKATVVHQNGSNETKNVRVKFIGMCKSADTGEFLYIGVDERSNSKRVLTLREAHKEDLLVQLVKYFQSKVEFSANGEQKITEAPATS